jgi:hypothetical protein
MKIIVVIYWKEKKKVVLIESTWCPIENIRVGISN